MSSIDVRLRSFDTGAATLVSGIWVAEKDSFCEGLYGGIPRRIGYASALAYGFSWPIMAGNTIYASSPGEDMNTRVGDEPWNHVYEDGEFLTVGAVRIGERTWLSLPPRAMLEIFGRTRNRSVTMSALRFLYDFHFDPVEIAELANTTSLTVGLRRMCSVVDQLEKTAGWDPPLWAAAIREGGLLDTSQRAVLLDRSTQRTVCLHDEHWNIDWNASPEELESYFVC